ncbi:hypothetical protein VNI00_009499 [Paramarasmius palmivorus]|uniref:Uncharacterized protein n=1 Tax=Paramarasmius palmivorus TaxID=297713 RepID=A0AAW0CRI6_9AGAR
MGSLCLSSPANLRCLGLTQTDYIALIIPPALEFLFVTCLLVRPTHRRNLLLASECYIYFVLSLLDSLSHLLPAVRDDLNAFKSIDITLGATSSLSLLLYTLFLYFFTVSSTLSSLPSKFHKPTKLLFLLFIPLIILFNLLASFLGIIHLIARLPNSDKLTLAIDFASPREMHRTLHTVFASFSLAILTLHQALSFIFAFTRLIKAFINSRRIETSSSDEVVLFKGIGWINAGIKLGAIETTIGLVGVITGEAFSVIMARRVLRCVGRGCLVVGCIKGVDFSEDFRLLQSEMKANSRQAHPDRRSLRPFNIKLGISNPRLSTFRQLSPAATSFHANLSRRPSQVNPYLSPNPGNTNFLSPDMKEFSALRSQRQRVTVHFDQSSGRAPTLEMRFSALDMPSPALIAESVNRRSSVDGSVSVYTYQNTSPLTTYTYTAESVPLPKTVGAPLKRSTTLPSTRPTVPSMTIRNAFLNTNASTSDLDHSNSHRRDPSAFSGFSAYSEMSTNTEIRVLAEQFPGLPPRVTGFGSNGAGGAGMGRSRSLPRNPKVGLSGGGGVSRATSQKSPSELSRATSQRSAADSGVAVSRATSQKSVMSRASSIKRKPVPMYIDPFEDDDDEKRVSAAKEEEEAVGFAIIPDTDDSPRNGNRETRVPSSYYPSPTYTPSTTTTTNPFKYDHDSSLYPASVNAYPTSFIGEGEGSLSTPADGTGRVVSLVPSEVVRGSSVGSSLTGAGNGKLEVKTRSLVREGDREELESGVVDPYRSKRDTAQSQELSPSYALESIQMQHAQRVLVHRSKPSLTRIKSMGVSRATRKSTPTPTASVYTRDSVAGLVIDIPPRDSVLGVVIDRGRDSGSVVGDGVASVDSGVLGRGVENVYVRRY